MYTDGVLLPLQKRNRQKNIHIFCMYVYKMVSYSFLIIKIEKTPRSVEKMSSGVCMYIHRKRGKK